MMTRLAVVMAIGLSATAADLRGNPPYVHAADLQTNPPYYVHPADLQTNPPYVQEQRPAFRAFTHAVAVDVAVFDGDHIVPSLGVSDFEVLDNGVRQTVSAVDPNLLPIDLRLVFDTSGSIRPDDLEKYQRAMTRVAAILRPEDRCEIFTFSSHIADAAKRQNPPIKIALQRTGPDGTAFFDAVSLAMITVPAVDRRHITIVLSDADDNSSFFDEGTLVAAARRTDAVVYTIMPPELATLGAPFVARLQLLSRITGGRVVRAQQDREMGNIIIDALEEFRQSYVLRYTLSGVDPDGWHKLTVKVRRPNKYTLRAREGYFGR